MRVIVFDRELHEPLTVVEVPEWLAKRAKMGEAVALPIAPEIAVGPPSGPVSETVEFMRATLTFEPVHRGKEILFWYAYADDPTTALLLRCAFLPGQVSEVQRRETMAYTEGLVRALSA